MEKDAGVGDWVSDGLCGLTRPTPKSVGKFFPSDGAGVEKARATCKKCPVKMPCLEYALNNRIDNGIWGGTSERQRRRILKQRREESVTGVGSVVLEAEVIDLRQDTSAQDQVAEQQPSTAGFQLTPTQPDTVQETVIYISPRTDPTSVEN